MRPVGRVTRGPESSYFTYPHCNGFWNGGPSFVMAQTDADRIRLLLFDPRDGATRFLGELPRAELPLYYSVAAGRIACVNGNTLYVLEPDRPPQALFTPDAPWQLGDLCDLSPDGETVLTDRHCDAPSRHIVEERRIGTGAVRVLLDVPWLANHVHYSPHDPRWIAFSHEGPATKIGDRIWGWHDAEAPEGRPLFIQRDAEGRALFVGHERAAAHRLSLLAVIYGNSPGEPAGLAEIDFSGNSRLVSPGRHDWHCNVSRDGRWAVIDTAGPHDAPGSIGEGWWDSETRSDVLAVCMRTGRRAFLGRAHFERRHPYHPHPHISPDNRWVVFNDAADRCVRAVEVDLLSGGNP